MGFTLEFPGKHVILRAMTDITAAQCRAARALLRWSQPQLAAKARVGIVTIQDFESEKRAPRTGTLLALRVALEAAGVKFTNGDEPGVKLARRPSGA